LASGLQGRRDRALQRIPCLRGLFIHQEVPLAQFLTGFSGSSRPRWRCRCTWSGGTRAFLAPGACGGYKASLLALSASVFTSAIAALVFYLRASRHAHALD
jgi:hypothetical protein